MVTDLRVQEGVANRFKNSNLFSDRHLDAVRNVWRNSTMHAESKYTLDEAEHIFVSVKGFMRKLAFRMDENGTPLA